MEISAYIAILCLVAVGIYGAFWEIKHVRVAIKKEERQTAMYARLLHVLEDKNK